jgi:predicted lipoprotein
MSAPAWVPQAPHADQPRDLMPPESRALLRRLDRLAERLMATYPAHAEAVRRALAEKEASHDGDHAA